MRKTATILVSALLLAVLAAQFSSCEKYVLPDLTISSDTLRFSAAADSQMLVVTTNVITTIYPENADNWVKANPEWMDQSSTVCIRVSENPGPEPRTATVPVKSEAILRSLVIIQEGTPSDTLSQL